MRRTLESLVEERLEELHRKAAKVTDLPIFTAGMLRLFADELAEVEWDRLRDAREELEPIMVRLRGLVMRLKK